MEVAGRDGELEGILEIRSLQVNFQEEGVSRFMDGSRYKCGVEQHGSMGGLFGRQGACLLLTRSVHSDGFRFVAEAGYPCGPVSESVNKGSKGMHRCRVRDHSHSLTYQCK